ncbi:hypothetical protein FB446DRAFT_730531 [Lentinula raphanica]|nr:hypothetical protein FB446DRAFT_730531 [Lentinula raphanica]
MDRIDRHEINRNILDEDFQKTATIKVWLQEGSSPIILRIHIPSYPLFSLATCPQIFDEIMQKNWTQPMATYDPVQKEWQYHTASTVREVPSSRIMAYRAIPAGITGIPIQDCPGLAETISLYHSHNPLPNSVQRKRQWPAEYSYTEIVSGMRFMKELYKTGPPEAIYFTAFPDAHRYASSTFNRHKKFFDRAESLGLITPQFETDSWENFYKKNSSVTRHNSVTQSSEASATHLATETGQALSSGLPALSDMFAEDLSLDLFPTLEQWQGGLENSSDFISSQENELGIAGFDLSFLTNF